MDVVGLHLVGVAPHFAQNRAVSQELPLVLREEAQELELAEGQILSVRLPAPREFAA